MILVLLYYIQFCQANNKNVTERCHRELDNFGTNEGWRLKKLADEASVNDEELAKVSFVSNEFS